MVDVSQVLEFTEPTAPPLYSIILPTHNRALMLCRAIASVVNQTYNDFELIVVDDASKDATQDVAAAFGDPRIRFIRLEQNAGASAARNAGIRAALGRYIVFLDDDDEFLPDLLKKMHSALLNAPVSIGFAWCGSQRVRMRGAERELVRIQRWEAVYSDGSERTPADLRYLQVGTGFGLTVRKDCFDKIGMFDEDMQAAVDADLMFRLGAAYDYVVVPEVLVTIFLHGGDQLTDRNERRAQSLDRLIQNNIGVISQHDKLWIGHHLGAAKLYYHVGNRRRGRRMILRAIGRQPLRWRTWKSWVLYEIFGHENLGLRRVMHRYIPILSLSRQPVNDRYTKAHGSQV